MNRIPFTEVLSNIVDNRGKTCPTADDGLPLIATNCIRNEYLYPTKEKVRYVDDDTYENWFRGHPKPGDIIFVTKGSPGRVCMTPDPVDFCIAQDMVAVRADPEKIDPDFLFAVLRSQDVQVQIGNMHVGTMIPHFKKGDFDKLFLTVPEDRKVQEFIGTIYRQFSDKIELNHRMNATLESLARAIFESWFVDFDPVKINAGQMPPSSHDQKVLELFPSTFQDSELGPIPEGWRIETLGDYVELQRGKTYKSKLKGTPGPHLLGLGSIERNGGFRADKLVTYGGDSPENLLVYPGDLYVSLKDVTQSADLLGSVARVPTSIKVGRMTQDTVKLVFNENAPSRNIVYRTLLTPAYRDHCRSHATGTTNLGLAREDFLSYPLIVPPKEIESAYDETMSRIEGQIDTNDRESTSLGNTRDVLLPKLLSGELTTNPSPEN